MAFEQMTLSDWMEIKEKIRKDLSNVKHAFVRVGYHLRRIRDEEMYKQDGYATLADFAKEEYGLEASTVSRLISINEKFSVDGYSEMLLPEYEDFKQASLTEMLALPVSDLSMITPDTSREEIRDLKRFNKAAAGSEDFREFIEEFGRSNHDLINDLYGYSSLSSTAERDLIEMINPSGSRTFKKGLYFLSFTDTQVKVKKFGGTPMDMTYREFTEWIELVFGNSRMDNAWEEYFGYPEGQQDIMPAPIEEEEVETEEIAPAQIVPETRINTECEDDSEEEKIEGENKEDTGTDDRGSGETRDEDEQSGEGSEVCVAGAEAGTGEERGADAEDGGDQEEAGGTAQAEQEPEFAGKEHEDEEEEKQEEIARRKVVDISKIAPVQSSEKTQTTEDDLKGKINKILECLIKEIQEERWLSAEMRVDALKTYFQRMRRK